MLQKPNELLPRLQYKRIGHVRCCLHRGSAGLTVAQQHLGGAAREGLKLQHRPGHANGATDHIGSDGQSRAGRRRDRERRIAGRLVDDGSKVMLWGGPAPLFVTCTSNTFSAARYMSLPSCMATTPSLGANFKLAGVHAGLAGVNCERTVIGHQADRQS